MWRLKERENEPFLGGTVVCFLVRLILCEMEPASLFCPGVFVTSLQYKRQLLPPLRRGCSLVRFWHK